jgi:peptidoglycan/LPS O-acetylase OafA/YrhL
MPDKEFNDMNSRITGFDYLRTFAAFSVVWIHGCYANPVLSSVSIINNYAVPAFILMSIFLLCTKDYGTEVPFNDFFVRLAKRIIPQFTFWTIFYLVLKYLKTRVFHTEFDIDLRTVLTGGVAVQLWFLPAIIIWQTIIFCSLRVYKNQFIDLFFVVITFGTGYYLHTHKLLSIGFETYMAVYTGYAFAASVIYKYHKKLSQVNCSIWIFLCIIIFIVHIYSRNYINYILNILWCSFVFLFCLNGGFKENAWIKQLSVNSFGIYLVHFCFLQVIYIFGKLIQVDTGTVIFGLSSIILSFFASSYICTLFKRDRFLKYVV